MHQPRVGMEADMSLQAEVPDLALLRLMHLWIARLGLAVYRGRSCDQRGIDDHPFT